MNAEQKEFEQIEEILYNEFIDYKNDKFLLKDKEWGEHEITDYEGMIYALTSVVQQHVWDEELKLSEIGAIDPKLWDKWLQEYAIPEESCPYCSNGCKHCLMTEW